MAKKSKKQRQNEMHECLVRMYGRLVMWGTEDIEDVPENFRDEVEAWVEENADY